MAKSTPLAPDESGHAFEFVSAVEVDDDLASLAPLEPDGDRCAEAFAQQRFKLQQVRRPTVGGCCVGVGGILSDACSGGSGLPCRNQGLGLSHREVLGNHALTRLALTLGCGEPEDCACMALRNLFRAYRVL